MLESAESLLTPTFLQSVWALEYEAFKGSAAEEALIERLNRWASGPKLAETSAQSAFIRTFFVETWGYSEAGTVTGSDFTLWPQYAVGEAGAGGGTGSADLAMGYFTAAGGIPQVLCEYKGVLSQLDAPQARKGSSRSPVQQSLDYLRFARRGFVGSEPITPNFAVVSDMNEFRLYWWDRGRSQSISFVLRARDLFQESTANRLSGNGESARFARYAFLRLFHRDMLLSAGGPPELVRLINQRRGVERKIEEKFYKEYRQLRQVLYTALLAANGPGTPRYPGTLGRLVRLAQKLLDRLLFIAYCDDMGGRLAYPPKLLKETLRYSSRLPLFDPRGQGIWQELLALFERMNEGGVIGTHTIPRFNGGLFAPDPMLESLRIPNSVFCQHLQGVNDTSIEQHPNTVLYLLARYDFAADLGGSRERSLGLYTLGRIFEQSITELEMLEAEVDERPSLNRLSQRKTDGVYYTPEWVVELIVTETLDPVLAALKARAGYPTDASQDVTLEAADAYRQALREVTVCDPACGSGAFLVAALRHLQRAHRDAVEAVRKLDAKAVKDETEAVITARVLNENIFGIDINPASVEIAQLALWLHTVAGDTTLAVLDGTIRCGNALVTEDIHADQTVADDERERINAFDWREAFPQVAARGGFDVVVGNPPYVKLQNFRQAFPEVADYLQKGRAGAAPPFLSTGSGNFDLYLPFIEQGIAMLSPRGRLGYIAPSLWVMNKYGAALRGLMSAGRHLEGWVDFVGHQVFDDVTIYTALQFYTRAPSAGIRVARAPDGRVTPGMFDAETPPLAWGDETFGDRWLMLGGPERALLERLRRDCDRLGDAGVTTHIFQGLITGLDDIYHLRRLGPGIYQHRVPAAALPGMKRSDAKTVLVEVAIEDAVMRPLVSGAEAKRYQTPKTETYILFPYEMTGEAARLIPASEMAARFPKAWAYLQMHETSLRRREAKKARGGEWIGPFIKAADWHAFGRNQNLDKQHLSKLVVPRLVLNLSAAFDTDGTACLDNVDVGGVVVDVGVDPSFVLAVLNGSVANFVFRRITKPFRGGYGSANRQFIEPIPIPHALPEQRASIAHRAEALQTLHTRRRDTLNALARRRDAVPKRKRPPEWLFATLRTVDEFIILSPKSMVLNLDRAKWAREQHAKALVEHEDGLLAGFRREGEASAELRDGELVLLKGGVVILDRIFPPAIESPFILAQWQAMLGGLRITTSTKGARLSEALRSLASPDHAGVVEQFLPLVTTLLQTDDAIRGEELAMEEALFDLYGLSDAERKLVLAG